MQDHAARKTLLQSYLVVRIQCKSVPIADIDWYGFYSMRGNMMMLSSENLMYLYLTSQNTGVGDSCCMNWDFIAISTIRLATPADVGWQANQIASNSTCR